jgi:hypothetical protein
MLRALLVVIAFACCGALRAHTVPVVVIEAEFSSTREAVIKVNLDPRLFLSKQPTAVPPVPASWWFEQDEAGKQKTRSAAAAYVERTFAFNVGATALKAGWKVEAIDSASAFPLGEASTEAHLLVEHHGPLPPNAGDFKLAVGKDCAVAVILLCSNIGDAERRPQSLFPGETSRAFPLPSPPEAVQQMNHSQTPESSSIVWLARLAWFTRSSHFVGDHLALAALLGLALAQRPWRAVSLLMSFHMVDVLATCLVMAGWLPSAPPWMAIAFWGALALTAAHLVVLKSRISSVLVTLAVAGLCHGLDTPHLHLDSEPAAAMASIFMQTGRLMFLELAVLAVCASLLRLTRHRTPPHATRSIAA